MSMGLNIYWVEVQAFGKAVADQLVVVAADEEEAWSCARMLGLGEAFASITDIDLVGVANSTFTGPEVIVHREGCR